MAVVRFSRPPAPFPKFASVKFRSRSGLSHFRRAFGPLKGGALVGHLEFGELKLGIGVAQRLRVYRKVDDSNQHFGA